MDGLSPELLENIAHYLDACSLANFATCNKQCRAVSLRFIFNTINIKFASLRELAQALEETITTLETTASYKHVHHVRFFTTHSRYAREWYGPGYDGTWLRPHEDRGRLVLSWASEELVPRKFDPPWADLCSFLKSLPALREFTWAAGGQLPLEILTHLHSLSGLRLHMLSFNLPSLLCGIGRPPQPSIQDLELARSPLLYRIDRATFMNPHPDYNEDALFEVVAGGLLKRLSIRWLDWNGGERRPHIIHPPYPHTRIPWPTGMVNDSTGIGALESISLYGIHAGPTLKKLSHYTDFSVLKSMSLYGDLDPLAFDYCLECKLPALEHLTLGWQSPKIDVATITSFPSLSSVCVYNHYNEEALSSILNHCGYRLRDLHCKSNCIDAELVAKLLHTCPQIEALGFCMYRDAGSATELALYHSLGCLPALREVELQLHPHQNLPYTTDPHSSEGLDQLYHILVDITTDRQLASSISRAIASTKSEFAVPFEVLRISTGASYHVSCRDFLESIGRSWEWKRGHQNERCSHPWTAQAFDPCERHEVHQTLDRERFAALLASDSAPAIHRAWPESRHHPLEEVMHSFLLYDEEVSVEVEGQ